MIKYTGIEQMLRPGVYFLFDITNCCHATKRQPLFLTSKEFTVTSYKTLNCALQIFSLIYLAAFFSLPCCRSICWKCLSRRNRYVCQKYFPIQTTIPPLCLCLIYKMIMMMMSQRINLNDKLFEQYIWPSPSYSFGDGQ